MPALFGPRSTAVLRTFLVGLPVVLLLGVSLNTALETSSYQSGDSLALEQPVPFSHRHHVGGLGLECRYCHTGVDRDAFAGMPPTETCMTCHSQIWSGADLLAPVRESARTGRPIPWQRVYRLPKHVYFHHGVHVRNGVSCESCHGAVGAMPLLTKHRPFTMKECLECHRAVEASDSYRNPDGSRREAGWLTRCNTCHR